MRCRIAADVPRTAAAHAVVFRPLLPGANNRRMLAQAEIIIAGKITVLPPGVGQKTACTVFHYPANAKSVPRPALFQRGLNTSLPGHMDAAL